MSDKLNANPKDTVLDYLRKGRQDQKELVSKTLLEGFKKDLLKDVNKAIPNYSTPISPYDLKCVENLLDKISPDELESFLTNVGGSLKNFFEKILFPKTGNNQALKSGYYNLIKAASSEKKLAMDLADILNLNIPLKVHSFFSNIANAFTEWISPDEHRTEHTEPSPNSVVPKVDGSEESQTTPISVAPKVDGSEESQTTPISVAPKVDGGKTDMTSDKFHLRAFVREKQTGKPIEGIPVLVSAQTKRGPEVVLGILASNHVGYVSFDMSHKNIKVYDHIWVYAHGGYSKIDAKPIIDNSPEDATILLDRDKPLIDADGNNPNLPSIQNPTVDDFLTSPNSFAVNPNARLGSGTCENLLPANYAEHEFSFRQVVFDPRPPITVNPSHLTLDYVDEKNSIPLKIRYGEINEYKISWIPLGHSLGRLVYSVPLAPCESVNLAVVDWSRADAAQRGEDLNVAEQLIHSQRRDRIIEETVTAGLAEWQRGGSVMGGIAGSYNTGAAAISGAAGAAYTTSSGDRDITVSTIQRIADNISQASNSIRNLHSTVVIQSSQSEKDVVQTRVVTNHNHCHALTILYYEVLRHYRVVTKLYSKQDALLIGFPIVTFNQEKVLRYRQILEQALIDKRMLPCFDAVSQLECYRQIAAETHETPASTNLDFVFVTLKAKFNTGEEGTLGDARVTLILNDGRHIRLRSTEPTNLEDDRYALRKPASILSNPTFGPNREDWFNLEPEVPVRWGAISIIEIALTARDAISLRKWTLSHFYLEGSVASGGSSGAIFDENINHLFKANEPQSMVKQVRVTLPQVVSFSMEGRRPEEMIKTEERCCITRLITHLNSNKIYYSNAIRMFGDYNETLSFLENYPPLNNHGNSLMDHIENRLVTAVGSYTVFPLKRERLLDGDGHEDLSHIKKNNHKGKNLSLDIIVSVPTRGLFAESQLSHCNSCEEKDITKFWDWSESPCPEKPPEIQGVIPGTRAQQQNLTPTNLPNSVVNIVNPQNAPDPTGVGAAMNVLAASNIFRDMSGIQQVGSLLNNLVASNASRPTSSPGSSTGPTSSQSSATGDRSSTSGGRTTTGGTTSAQAPSRPSPQEQHDQLQVNRNAVEHGELTSQQGRDLGRRQLEETTGASQTGSTTEQEGSRIQNNSITYNILLADFDRNGTSLKPAHMEHLRNLIDTLVEGKTLPTTRIGLIEGHAKADERDTQNLSIQRANEVRDYLISNGLNRNRLSGDVQGTGSTISIRGNAGAPELDVNRSVMLSISSTLQSLALGTTTIDTDRSNEWELRLIGRGVVAGKTFYIQIKNVRNGQVRTGVFVGGGIYSLEYVNSRDFDARYLPSITERLQDPSLSTERWYSYRISRQIDFDDFNCARAVVGGDPQLEYFIGPTHISLEFPGLDPGNSIDLGELDFDRIVCAATRVNNGIWKEIKLPH